MQPKELLVKLATSGATETGRRSSGTRLGKGNTKSGATKIVELLITEQVSRTAEPLKRALSVNYR